MMNLSQ
jgi:hypothetical protein